MTDTEELKRLRHLLEHAPGYIVLSDLDARCLYINRVDGEYSIEDTIGASFYDFLGPDQATHIRAAHAAVLETGEDQTVEYVLDAPSDRRMHLIARLAGYRSRPDGPIDGFVNVVTDVTDRRIAEQRVAELEAQRARDALAREITRTELILDTMMDGYVLVDTDGVVVACNESMARLWNQPRESIIGQPFDASLRSYAPGFDEIMPELVDRRRMILDSWIVRADGERLELRVSLSRLDHGDGMYFVCVIHDVTEERKAQRERSELVERMQQQHRLHSLGTLAGGAAHEINNPIQSIISFSELIKRRGSSSGLAQFADEILSEAHRIARIVRNLSTFARADSESHSPARMSDIVEAALSLMHHSLARDGIQVEVEVPDDLPQIKCRSQQIRQILVNVLANARDALNARFEGHDPDKLVRIRASVNGTGAVRSLRLTVEDNGDGIAGADLPHVFDPFFTTRQNLKRSGLGLSVSHGIASEHHGELTVDSRPGQPTCVHLDLPVDNGWTLDG